MHAVLLQVRQIVDQINRARCEAEREEASDRTSKRIPAEELYIECQRGKHEDVFRPLARSHAAQDGKEHGGDHSRINEGGQGRLPGGTGWSEALALQTGERGLET